MPMNPELAELTYNLLHPLRLPNGMDGATEEQRRDVADATRALAAWSQKERPNGVLFRLCAELTMDTIDVDVTAGVKALELILVDEVLKGHAYEVVPAMCKRAALLIGKAPDLLEKLCMCAFLPKEEVADGQAKIGSSQIAAFSMNTRQLFQDGPRALVPLFPAFLAAHPQHAMRIVAQAIDRYVEEKHVGRAELYRKLGETQEARTSDALTFRGKPVRFEADVSGSWGDARIYRDDEPRALLDHWERWLSGLATAGTDIGPHVDYMLSLTGLAVVWSRIIRVARQTPAAFGGILELCTAPVLLLGGDVRKELGKLVGLVHAQDASGRESIERALLGLPQSADAADHEWASRICQIYALEIAAPVLPELLAVKAAAVVKLPPRAVRVRQGGDDDDDDEWETDYVRAHLRESGATLETPEDRAFADSVAALRASTARTREAINVPAVEGLLAKVKETRATLEAPGTLHDAQLADARRAVAEALFAASHSGGFDERPDIVAELATLSLKHCANADDGPLNEGFHTTEASEAAGALTLLCRHNGVLNDDVRAALRRLAMSPSESVRHHVALFVHFVARRDAELGWELIERLGSDVSTLVLGGLVHSLDHLARSSPDLAHAQLCRLLTPTVVKGVADHATTLLAILFIHVAFKPASATLDDLLKEYPSERSAGLDRVGHHARKAIERTRGERNAAEVDVSRRAWDLVTRFALRARSLWDDAVARFDAYAGEPLPDEERERNGKIAELMDDVASQLYFGSGAFHSGPDKLGPALEGSELIEFKRKYFERAQPALKALTAAIHPRTAHHLVQMLVELSDGEPRGVFLAVRDVVRAAKESGYGNEPMAHDQVIALVKRYLAEHRAMLQREPECREAMEEVLSVFVTSGFRSAILLAKDLDAVFR